MLNIVFQSIEIFNVLLNKIFSTGTKWKNRRRIITPAFHDKELLNNFVDIYNEQTTILIQRLSSISSDKETNLYPYIASCALDIICGKLIKFEYNLFVFRCSNEH